jgi:hypothetical protein
LNIRDARIFPVPERLRCSRGGAIEYDEFVIDMNEAR